jgi:hypothetical protein
MTQAPSKRVYRLSPFGEAVHPWLNKADTKYNADGLFHTGLKLSGPAAQKFAEEIREASDRYFAELTESMTPGERKKWSVYYPFEEQEDDEGNKTGVIVFDFKQNAKIKLKSGEVKEISLRLQDGAGKDTKKAIFGGSTIRTMYAPRDVKMTSSKEAGVRLDFCGVQVTKLAEGRSGGGFGAVEGAWTDEGGEDEQQGFGSVAGSGSADGDY